MENLCCVHMDFREENSPVFDETYYMRKLYEEILQEKCWVI